MGSREKALAALNNLESEFKGIVLKLNCAKPKKKKPSSLLQPKPLPVRNLFVANLSYQARAKDLMDFFNADGANVVSAEVIFQDNPRRSAGNGVNEMKVMRKTSELVLTCRSLWGERESRTFLRQETKSAIQSERAEVN
ncbi:uncharacterized protein LOC105159032 [Sesamum indicum]|uniref:Uncharacterized protein LOC105159032 n=1 Tax=Sesamum indicum TaxID=4182 RepID=A0A6I9T216_SESIN|nr:uncharacterized protein LOC105159032 [Sesamum indicum]